MRKHRADNIDSVPPYNSKRKTGDIEEYADRQGEPKVVLNADVEKYFIEGVSNLLQAREFYTEILVWLAIYGPRAIRAKRLEVHLFDFNASSALYLSKVFELWVSLDDNNRIAWHFHPDDEWGKESAEIFNDLFDERFDLIPDKQMPKRPRQSSLS
jgi:hypothetical protein